MRASIVKTVFLKELRELLRDRRSLLVMFGIPVIIYPLVIVLVGTVGANKRDELEKRAGTVAVVPESAAPRLVELIGDPKSGLTIQPTPDPAAALAAGEIDAIIRLTDDAQTASLEARPAKITVELDRSRTPTLVAERRINAVLDRFQRWVIDQRLASRGLPPDLVAPLDRQTVDTSTGETRFGKILSLSLPLLVLVTGMLGAFFPALNATTTERELGTLETLLVTPVRRGELLFGKALLVLLTALLTAAINVASISLVMWHISNRLEGGPAGAGLSISFTAMALTFLAALPTLITFATLVLILGLVARTFREANSLATPVMMIPMASVLVSLAEPKATPGLLVTPVANTTIIIRDVLTGQASVGPFVLAFVSSCVYAALMLSVAARMFSSEQLVNPSWEPVSIRGLKDLRRGLQTSRLPAVDEVVTLFCVCLLLLFYVSPSLASRGLPAVVLGNQLFLIALPTLLAAWLLGWDRVRTFLLHRASLAAMIGAAAIGLGMIPLAQVLSQFQQWLMPRDPESMRPLAELLLPWLQNHPIGLAVMIGVSAGVCEELLFRGAIQQTLLKTMRPAVAIGIAAVLFAVMHMDLHGVPLRTVLGVVLGWVAFGSGSIFPAMIAHAVYDIVQLLYAGWMIRGLTPEAAMSTAAGLTDTAIGATELAGIAGGVLLLAGGFALIRQARWPSADA